MSNYWLTARCWYLCMYKDMHFMNSSQGLLHLQFQWHALSLQFALNTLWYLRQIGWISTSHISTTPRNSLAYMWISQVSCTEITRWWRHRTAPTEPGFAFTPLMTSVNCLSEWRLILIFSYLNGRYLWTATVPFLFLRDTRVVNKLIFVVLIFKYVRTMTLNLTVYRDAWSIGR